MPTTTAEPADIADALEADLAEIVCEEPARAWHIEDFMAVVDGDVVEIAVALARLTSRGALSRSGPGEYRLAG